MVKIVFENIDLNCISYIRFANENWKKLIIKYTF